MRARPLLIARAFARLRFVSQNVRSVAHPAPQPATCASQKFGRSFKFGRSRGPKGGHEPCNVQKEMALTNEALASSTSDGRGRPGPARPLHPGHHFERSPSSGEHRFGHRKTRAGALGAVFVAVLLMAVCSPTAAGTTLATPLPECIDVWGEAIYRNDGYDHIVHVNNRCDASAICDVATNVNPVPQRITVGPKQEVEVLTFRGAATRDFQPRAECLFILDSRNR